MQTRAYAIAILTSIVLMIPLAAAQTSVQIVVKGGSVESMQPEVLQSGMPYTVQVKVMDENGGLKTGSTVSFRIVGGSVTIQGDSSATTGSDGMATLSLWFTAGGIVRLYVDDSRITTLTIEYSSPPTGAFAVIAVLFIVLVVAVGYTAYVGPVKWARSK